MRFDVAKKIFEDEDEDAGKLAFAAADKDLSWAELKIYSDKICDALKKAGVSEGRPVLVYGDKTAFCLTSILSCFRLGLPFVMISPEWPSVRMREIARQCGSAVFLSAKKPGQDIEVRITIGSDMESAGSSISFQKTYPDLAYILFTSGSSGHPKGVLISRANLASFITWFAKNLPVSKETVFINQADLSFDISLADFFGTLHMGGSAIFNPPEIYNNDRLFFKNINKYGGNYWNSTPSFALKYIVAKDFHSEKLPTIKQFVLSGENLSSKLAKEIRTRFPKAEIINAYGPTETTIFSSRVQISPELLMEDSIPIAKTGDGGLLLENDEIIISSDAVGQGYLNQPEKTREKFISLGGKPAFKTGDYGRISQGYIYFAGRSDNQIKLSGYRIELGEIKLALEKIRGIEEAECFPVLVDGRVKRLIAFVRVDTALKTSGIKEILIHEIPAYMIPSEIISVKEFPRNANFKTDREKLLENYLKGLA